MQGGEGDSWLPLPGRSPCQPVCPSHWRCTLASLAGGALGGGLGALLIVALIVFFVKRRQGRRGSATGALPTSGHGHAGGLRGAYAVSNPAYTGGASAYVSTAAVSKEAFALTEVVEATGTPRSARRRAATSFN